MVDVVGEMGDFTCEQCNKQFASKANVKRHIRQVHNTEPKSPTVLNKTISCTVCESVLPSRIRLVDHLQSEHNIQITTSKFTFRSREEFMSWKETIERETCSFFVSTTSSTNGGKKTKFYTCHRSGFHRRMGVKRNLKRKGSNKINGTCPAHLKMVQNVDGSGKLHVTYMSTHVGHTNNVGRMRLTAQERKAIAEQLQQGIPNSTILTNVHEYLDPSKRLTYLTKKDLHNIRASFNLKSEIRLDAEETTKVENWVQKCQTMVKSPILGYKPIGRVCAEFPNLKDGEFFLAYMSDVQVEICQHYGDNVVLCSATHGTNPYKIQLFTVMVVDDNGDGFPVAFMYSISDTEDVYAMLFHLMSTKLNDLSPMTFISDDEPAGYKAWVKVFGQPFKKLLSPLSLKCDWNKNLISKIKNQEKLNQVQAELYAMQEEADPEKFERMLNELIDRWNQDEETSAFGTYFKGKYTSRWKEWAACHRKVSELNTNSCVERWQQELRLNSSITQQRMDGAIRHLVNCLNRKFSSFLLSNINGSFCGKLNQLRNCGSIESVELIIEMQEVNKRWLVSSNTGSQPSDTFQVKLMRSNNVAWKRELVCDVCSISVHGFTCSCTVAKSELKLCEHLHYVCLVFGLGDRRTGSKFKSNKSNQAMEVEMAKEEKNGQLLKIVDDLKTFINNCSRVEQLREVKQQCEHIRELLEDRIKVCSVPQDIQSVVGEGEEDQTKEPFIVVYKTLPLNVYTCHFKSPQHTSKLTTDKSPEIENTK